MLDILLNTETLDVQIVNNDLLLGESDNQHKALLAIAEPGSLKESPMTGVGISNYLESEETAAMLAEIKTQYTADGMDVKKVYIENGIIKTDANY